MAGHLLRSRKWCEKAEKNGDRLPASMRMHAVSGMFKIVFIVFVFVIGVGGEDLDAQRLGLERVHAKEVVDARVEDGVRDGVEHVGRERAADARRGRRVREARHRVVGRDRVPSAADNCARVETRSCGGIKTIVDAPSDRANMRNSASLPRERWSAPTLISPGTWLASMTEWWCAMST